MGHSFGRCSALEAALIESLIQLGEPAKSLVDDLGFCRGVVLSRAAALLRSVETKPYDRWICLFEPSENLKLFNRWQACPVKQRSSFSLKVRCVA